MSKKTTTETGVSVAGQFELANVPAYLEQVNAQIKALEGDKERGAKITESLGVFGVISGVKDPNVLRDAYAFISRKAQAAEEYKSVFQEIDPLTPIKEFKEKGHTVKQWQEEILAQYRSVTFDDKLSKLKEAKKLLEDNLSAEHKFQATMANIAELFKS